MITGTDLRIAMVTPWPPQASGIADYARELRDGLRLNGLAVDVFTNAPGDTADHVYEISSADGAISELAGYQRILIQLGNHPFFHAYMAPIVAALGSKCTVELHDMRLDHMLAGLNYGGDPGFTDRWMLANYAGDDPPSNARPISDIVCRRARNVIVHSHYAANWLTKLGVPDAHVVDLSYELKEVSKSAGRKPPSGTTQIGMFGTFQQSRQIPLVLEALEILADQGVNGWHLHLVGRPCEGYETLLSSISASHIVDRISVHENVPMEEFLGLMAEMDVHVALRSPTVGETSGVVVQGMTLGIPTIVTDVGWYAELPGIVEKIPETNGLYELVSALYRHISDESRRHRISSSTKYFAAEAYNLRRRAEEIGEILVNG